MLEDGSAMRDYDVHLYLRQFQCSSYSIPLIPIYIRFGDDPILFLSTSLSQLQPVSAMQVWRMEEMLANIEYIMKLKPE